MNLDGKKWIGLILVIFGGWLLLGSFGLISINVWQFLWPIIILGIGLGFEYAYFRGSRTSPGLLVPGGVLLVVGVNFLLNVIFGWRLMSITWPLFIIAPAFGLLQLYIFGKREKGVLIASTILCGIGGIFLAGNIVANINVSAILSVLLILVGGYLVINGYTKKSE